MALKEKRLTTARSSGFSLAPSSPVACGEIDLNIPGRAFGKMGTRVPLVANHFELTVDAEGENLVWYAWQLEFPQGEGQREPGKAVRMAAVTALMSQTHCDIDDWEYDGRNRLWSKNESDFLPITASVDIPGGRRPVEVKVTKAIVQGSEDVQQQLNLCNIGKYDANEETRFLQVCMRSAAARQKNLIVMGRRVLCPNMQLLADGEEIALKHGREIWMGFIAQLERVDSSKGPKSTLNLNLVSSVGLPEMSATTLVAKLMSESSPSRYSKEENEAWYQEKLEQAESNFPKELERVLRILNSEVGLRGLRVSVDYFGHARVKTVLSISNTPANLQKFICEGRETNVAKYFKEKYGKNLKCPGLPCLELTKKGNFVPLELVSICGGEHNILVGKLRGDYQADVVRRTAMDPSVRLRGIQNIMEDINVGPRQALKEKGIDVHVKMLNLNGRVLEKPVLVGKAGAYCEIGRYANSVKARVPPAFEVPWALWSFTRDSQSGLQEFAKNFMRVANERGLRFTAPQRVGWASKAYNSWLEEDLRQDLNQLHSEFPTLRMLVILLPDDSLETKSLYGHLKSISENEIRSFGTQCIQCKPKGGKNQMTGLEAGQQKLNNVMLKICSKLPERMTLNGPQGAAHHVCLREPHRLLQAKSKTMVIGADVTHNVVGVSVAGVVASRDTSFMTYFSEVQAQTPFDLEGSKTRRRKSEERILNLKDMIQKLLQRWKAANNCLPSVILYYRDGVSDGQFQPVLKMEMNQLVTAFSEFEVEGGKYNPQLAIIVGQKRHQTRFFRDVPNATEQIGKGRDAAKGGKGSQGAKGDGKHGKGPKGSMGGKGGKGNDLQVEPGTVAGEGIARPGHLNFFLVAHQGIKGTSVPCHYHVLHLDARLLKQVGIDDIERITFDLSHLYSRADKAVSYAAPTYLADHLCERGKLYLETKFAAAYQEECLSKDSEEQLQQQIDKRVKWFNVALQQGHEQQQAGHLQGLNYFC